MPELPEIETIKNALIPHLLDHCFVKIETFVPAMRLPLDVLHAPELLNKKVVDVRRRGRYLIIEMEQNIAFLMHLGMSGVIRIEPATLPKRKHEHVIMTLDNAQALRFECTRRFSMIKPCKLAMPGALPEELKSLGVEPLTDSFTAKYLFDQSRKRSGCVKNFIMDNAIVVGIGNIYAAESLFAAGISPLRPANSLTMQECIKLNSVIKSVLSSAILAGGTTISAYRHVDGSEGKFVQQLKMYGKAGQPCEVCQTTIEMVRLGGRSSCFCPKCQK